MYNNFTIYERRHIFDKSMEKRYGVICNASKNNEVACSLEEHLKYGSLQYDLVLK